MSNIWFLWVTFFGIFLNICSELQVLIKWLKKFCPFQLEISFVQYFTLKKINNIFNSKQDNDYQKTSKTIQNLLIFPRFWVSETKCLFSDWSRLTGVYFYRKFEQTFFYCSYLVNSFFKNGIRIKQNLIFSSSKTMSGKKKIVQMLFIFYYDEKAKKSFIKLKS